MDADTNRAEDTPALRGNPLAAVMRALQAIGDAVTHDDRHAYAAAVAHGEAIGLTDEQITDAYHYRARIRHEPPSFDRSGNPRGCR
ncbi:hypothetical protein [Actinocatenispora rupis]|uniref:Uncharacterized protein n=1 Tax=Actinocatenispora rupis TaxID=519421 RepID=A0A8J3IX03_9ACTN|nr:hypothetical protein [Actinocatenispora rupis]GID10215.1 hypothetical protein Aru02nite_11040 [Actinocatenispora rupis]